MNFPLYIHSILKIRFTHMKNLYPHGHHHYIRLIPIYLQYVTFKFYFYCPRKLPPNKWVVTENGLNILQNPPCRYIYICTCIRRKNIHKIVSAFMLPQSPRRPEATRNASRANISSATAAGSARWTILAAEAAARRSAASETSRASSRLCRERPGHFLRLPDVGKIWKMMRILGKMVGFPWFF